MTGCEDIPVAVSDVLESAALAKLLDDDCARRILIETKREPCSANELSIRNDVSEPTVYRRLERLEEHGLIAEEIEPVTDGKTTNGTVPRLTILKLI